MTTPLTTEKDTGGTTRAPSMVAELRRLVPNRPLSFAEACRVAELQATRLLIRSNAESVSTSESIITDLPRIEVRRVGGFISSGASAWNRGRWHIRLNGAEPLTRQRFTLAHEFKHILDAACEDVIYGHLAADRRERHVEAVCDHFAACLLMPKVAVKRLWFQGIQDLAGLAWRFEVSQQAMLIRLQYLGLVPKMSRHTLSYRLGAVAVRGSRRPGLAASPRRHPASRQPRRYFRSARPIFPAAISQGALT